MLVLIENKAKEPVKINLNGKELKLLTKGQLMQNLSACGTYHFIDMAEALNHVFSKAYTRRYELDMYGEPGWWDAKITILDDYG